VARRDGLAIEPLGLAGKPRQEARRVADLCERLLLWLAVLARAQLGEPALVGEHALSERREQLAALWPGAAAPARERAHRGGDGGIDQCVVAVGDLGDERTVVGIADGEPAGTGVPGTIDERVTCDVHGGTLPHE